MPSLIKNLMINIPMRIEHSQVRSLMIGGAALLWGLSAGHAVAEIAQSPLVLGGGNVPGNLALVPSVEYPTILTMANLGNYSSSTVYSGYFDPKKCYAYRYYANETDTQKSHFYPVSVSSGNATCADNQWSGNHLNWAATQTIDPFRSALTGGYRVVDTASLTILEKARNTGQGSYNSSRNTTKSISGTSQTIRTRLNNGSTGFGAKMQFTLGNSWDTYSYEETITTTTTEKYCKEYKKNGDCKTWGYREVASTTTETRSGNKSVVPYTGEELAQDKVYEAYVRVKVCDSTVGVESNCRQYGNNWKPEGLIQQYSNEIRYSVFGYLNDSSSTRDGGVLRANQKYVGPTARTVENPVAADNPNKEWDPATGVFYRNPDNITSSMGTTIADSGVINYINKFGQLTSENHKSIDPVSELYYTAIRYFRKIGNAPEYSSYAGLSNSDKIKFSDKLPVIQGEDWQDPILYSCQKNVILGIGDTNSHKDKNLPSAESTGTTNEPSKPSAITADTGVDVVSLTRKVQNLENHDTPGIDLKVTGNSFTGNDNSAYIAGLAYYANTTDIRPAGDHEIAGKQTISTHWVDVRENEDLKGKARNQYWLAAKYGGFNVPSDYGNLYDRSERLPDAWWTDGDTLSTNYLRPRNFYVASDANKMVESLKEAFAKIALEVRSTTTSISTNSTRLDTGTAVFQALLDSRKWSGDLLAKSVNSSAVVSSTPSWSAAAKLDALTDTEIGTRKVFTSTPPTTDTTTGAQISTTGSAFTWSGLHSSQQTLLQGGTPAVDAETGEKRVNYLRGLRTYERSSNNPSNLFRERGSRLGDIANSDPQFTHKQNFGYAQLPTSAGFTSSVASAYTTFRSTSSYQARPPVVVVGANDGMLHVFDARLDSNGGKELFAYVPHGVMANLYQLTLPAYAHRYYVDGTPRIGDAYINGAWKTLVIGSTGAGGKSIFALDITNPSSMSSSSVLWEFTHPEIGYTLGRPSLVALPNGKFGVVVTSGYERFNTDGTRKGNAYVWVLDAANGSVLKRFDLPSTGDLGSPLTIDLNNDKVADRIYAADTQGNVWRLDLTGSNPSNWGAPSSLVSGSTVSPLFIAKDPSGNRQAITAPLNAAYTPEKNVILLFGTGSYYRTTDNEIPDNPQVNSFYGIMDGGALIDGRSTLEEQEILKEVSNSNLRGRGLSNATLSDADQGWFIDLLWKSAHGGSGAEGERVVAQASLGGNRVTFSTLIPSDDPCAAGGSSWIMSVDLISGGRLPYSYFDYNGDGNLDENDYITLEDNTTIPVSGISDPDEGAVKGTITLDVRSSGKRYLCYASSASSTSQSGSTPVCIEVLGGTEDSNRLSWHELRSN